MLFLVAYILLSPPPNIVTLCAHVRMYNVCYRSLSSLLNVRTLDTDFKPSGRNGRNQSIVRSKHERKLGALVCVRECSRTRVTSVTGTFNESNKEAKRNLYHSWKEYKLFSLKWAAYFSLSVYTYAADYFLALFKATKRPTLFTGRNY